MTGILILVGLILYIIYDLWAYSTDKAPTLSHVLNTIGGKWPIFPGIIGAIMGGLWIHFFTP